MFRTYYVLKMESELELICEMFFMQYYCLMYELIWIWIGIILNCVAVKKLTCKLAPVNTIFFNIRTLNRKKNNRIFFIKISFIM